MEKSSGRRKYVCSLLLFNVPRGSTALMNPFGEELKRAREARNITLDDIFAKTKIQPKFIQAIEEGELDILPQAYVRAFLRSYAKCLNLDPAEVLLKCNQALAGSYVEKTAPTTQPTGSPPVERQVLSEREGISAGCEPESVQSQPSVTPSEEVQLWVGRRRIPIILALGLLIVVAAIFSIFYFGSEKPPALTSQAPIVSPAGSSYTTNDTSAALTKPVQAELTGRTSDSLLSHQSMSLPEGGASTPSRTTKESTKVASKSGVAKPNVAPPAISDSLTMVGATTAGVLVRVSIDGSGNRDYSLQPNMRKTWKAKERIVISLSDAGAISFTLNGKKIGKLGSSGTVVREVTVSKKGIRRP